MIMRKDIIDTLPDPDPSFVKILERIPDSSPEIEPKIIRSLPKLQDLFRKKQEAWAKKDMFALQKILSEEIEFVRDLGQIAFHS